MTETTSRLGLPLLQSGQAQKEVTHNSALHLLDGLVQAAVESVGDTAPPATPAVGQAWIVGASPGGAWTGKAQNIAHYTSNGWLFAAPRDGLLVWVKGQSLFARYAAGAWNTGHWPVAELHVAGQRVVSARQSAIPDPTGGGTADAQARAAIGQILATLRAHGLISA
jgi:hypothetical protein